MLRTDIYNEFRRGDKQLLKWKIEICLKTSFLKKLEEEKFMIQTAKGVWPHENGW